MQIINADVCWRIYPTFGNCQEELALSRSSFVASPVKASPHSSGCEATSEKVIKITWQVPTTHLPK
jgi:hypothetical protein